MRIQGRGILVTGASRGLGASLAVELARRGGRMALVARGQADLEAVAATIRKAGGEAQIISADVGCKEDVYTLSGTAAALVGDIDIVIHNASTLGPTPLRHLGDTACEDLEHVLAVNAVGPFRLTKALAGPMLVRGDGLIVHVSSDAAVVPYAGWGAYGVAKAALDHMGRIWATELAGTGVRFLAIDPGEMDTGMHADAVPDADRSLLARPSDVARSIADMIVDDAIPSGVRLEAAAWAAAR